jgi:hypothetical protein
MQPLTYYTLLEIETRDSRINMLNLKIKMLEARNASTRESDCDSDTSSVRSNKSGKSVASNASDKSAASNASGKSDGSNVFPTGMMIKVNGQEYPVVQGPKGGLYSMRSDGKHSLTPAQVRNQYPEPKKAAGDAMVEADVDDEKLNAKIRAIMLQSFN